MTSKRALSGLAAAAVGAGVVLAVMGGVEIGASAATDPADCAQAQAVYQQALGDEQTADDAQAHAKANDETARGHLKDAKSADQIEDSTPGNKVDDPTKPDVADRLVSADDHAVNDPRTGTAAKLTAADAEDAAKEKAVAQAEANVNKPVSQGGCAGDNGTNGSNGKDGKPGADGKDGAPGPAGAPGQVVVEQTPAPVVEQAPAPQVQQQNGTGVPVTH